MKSLLSILLLSATCLSTTGVLAQEEAAEEITKQEQSNYEERIERLENRLIALERRFLGESESGRGTMLADHEARLQLLETETSRVYGKTEEVAKAVELLANKVEMIASDIDLRLQDLEKAVTEGDVSAKKSSNADAGESVNIPADMSASNMYQQAYEKMQAKEFAVAEAWFKEFVNRFPENERTENAYYWWAEVLLAQDEPREALVVFREGLQKFPSGNKTADSLLKMGVAFQEIGQADLAKTTWQKLVDDFSASPSAELAKKKLTELD